MGEVVEEVGGWAGHDHGHVDVGRDDHGTCRSALNFRDPNTYAVSFRRSCWLTVELVAPSPKYVASYLHVLRAGWGWDDIFFGDGESAVDRARVSTSGLLQAFREDGTGYIGLTAESLTPKLPSRHRWIWENGFKGSINLRWQPGTHDLPPTCLGHIGYGVEPSSRRRGYATAALRQMLPLAWEVGLTHVDIVTDPENIASQRVIVHAGGELVPKPASLAADTLLWRIHRDAVQ